MPTIASLHSITKAADTLMHYDKARDASDLFDFQQHNLIYGYNGSGKTTLSRIFEYLGTGTCPNSLGKEFDFDIRLSDGTKLKRENNPTKLTGRVLVYNEDYIERNFKWEGATASPILGLGEAQIEVKDKLDAARTQAKQLEADLPKAIKTKKTAESDFKKFARDAAKTIETTAHYTRPGYQADQLRKDIPTDGFDPTATLADDALEAATQTAALSSPPEAISRLPQWPDALSDLAKDEISPLLQERAVQKRLPELDDHPEKETWVKEGYTYHAKNELGTCLHCGQKLTPGRYEQLAQHFSEAVNKLSSKATGFKEQVQQNQQLLTGFDQALPRPNGIVDELRSAYTPLRATLLELASDGIAHSKTLEGWLARKLASPATALEIETEATLTALATWKADLEKGFAELKELVNKHNKIVAEFADHKKAVQTKIRDHFLAEIQDRYQELQQAQVDANTALTALQKQSSETEAEIAHLLATIQTHAAAAPQINDAIKQFLRHRSITMEAVDEGYRLIRANGTPVVKLSEGEKTAVTFCHFITSLPANRDKKDLIVVVDDPISSLDTRSLNYMGGLIKQQLHKKVKQLFILTHNASFMMEMRKLLVPNWEIKEATKANKAGPVVKPIPLYQLTLLSNNDGSQRRSILENMSPLLRDYESEYHYLFAIVHHYSEQQKPTAEPFMLLPNAVRRVFETFLVFKAPGAASPGDAVNQINKDKTKVPALTGLRRFIDVESHGDNIASLTEPAVLSIEETHPAAMELMEFIKGADKLHYKMMIDLCKGCPVA